MIKHNVIFACLLCSLLFACNEDLTGDYYDDILSEEEPETTVLDVDGHDFVIMGDVDGEPFVIHHEGKFQYNAPANDGTSTSARPFFGTFFIIRYAGQPTEAYIVFGLTENGDSRFEDVVQVGTYDWFNHSYPSQSVGQATINQLDFQGDGMTNTTIPQSNPDNYFEITSITPLELDENMDEAHEGRIYKVEGHFAVDLDKWDNSDDVPRMTVEYFSAIFYDDSI